ncbi:hypothetical protein D3C75_771780 [compost metagenome]
MSRILPATWSSWFHGAYRPPSKPPQALKVQSTPRSSPLALITKVGPVSRTQASSLLISTTRMSPWARRARALAYCPALTHTVTGSKRAMALATATKAACAGLAPSRQLSGRSGQTIQVWLCGAHSAGMRKPSARGVVLRVVMGSPEAEDKNSLSRWRERVGERVASRGTLSPCPSPMNGRGEHGRALTRTCVRHPGSPAAHRGSAGGRGTRPRRCAGAPAGRDRSCAPARPPRPHPVRRPWPRTSR